MNKGFTLIEILVVVSIIILLTAITLPHLRAGEEQLALQRSGHRLAQDLRRAKEMAMSAKEFPGVHPEFIGAYGIKFRENSSEYILFADLNNDGVFSDPEEIERLTLEEGVTIQALFPVAADILMIVFIPPDPSISIQPPLITGFAAITIAGAPDLSSIIIKVNQAGLISIE